MIRTSSNLPAERVLLVRALQSLYDKVTPAFDAMGKKSFYLDNVGGGAKMKLVVNMIMGRYFNYTTLSFIPCSKDVS